MIKHKYRTLIKMLENRVSEEPDKIALTFHNLSPLTYGHLWKQINNLANYLLKQGLNPQDRVLIAVPNSYEFFWNICSEVFRDRMLKEYNRFWNAGRTWQRKHTRRY